MIKSLLGEDENTEKKERKTPEVKGGTVNIAKNSLSILEDVPTQHNVKTENTEVESPFNEIETIDEIKTAIETGDIPPREINKTPQNVQPFEINKLIGQPAGETNTLEGEGSNEPANEAISQGKETSTRTLELEKKLREIEMELKQEKQLEIQRLKKEAEEKVKLKQQNTQQFEPKVELKKEAEVSAKQSDQQVLWDNNDWSKNDYSNKAEAKDSIEIKQKDFIPESKAEGVRRMGMAWSAAIAFFGSVVFMLILGWGADLILGSEPWGIVVGIVIGAAIGFVQLIRTTSQIFKPNKLNDFDRVSLRSNTDGVANNKAAESIEKVEDKTAENIDSKPEELAPETSIQEVVNKTKTLHEEVETIVKTDS